MKHIRRSLIQNDIDLKARREMTDNVESSSIHDRPRDGAGTLNTSLARSYKLVRPGDQTRPGLG